MPENNSALPWLRTGDGFALCTVSLADQLNAMGITHTGLSSRNPEDVQSYYDDWYLYAVTRNGTTFSLLKMREQEHDYVPGYADLDDPGVTVSFISFDISLLEALKDEQNRDTALPAFVAGFRKTVELPDQHHSEALRQYFRDPRSEAAYLIADTYLKFLLRTYPAGDIPFPELMRKSPAHILAQLDRLNRQAGRTLCDMKNFCLHIIDPAAPTEEELYALLVLHTGNPSFNSFAAELKWHADALVAWESKLPIMGRKKWYASAVRADMQIEEEEWLRMNLFSPYYDENSPLVREQEELHGKR